MSTLTIILHLDDLHSNLLDLLLPLDALEEKILNENKRVEIRNVKRRIQSCGPITGLGFFDINKSAFLGFLSFAATYIVILLQFRDADA